jgi:hypothetical protein
VVDEDRDRAVHKAVVDRVEEQGGVERANGTGGERAAEARDANVASVSEPGSW